MEFFVFISVAQYHKKMSSMKKIRLVSIWWLLQSSWIEQSLQLPCDALHHYRMKNAWKDPGQTTRHCILVYFSSQWSLQAFKPAQLCRGMGYGSRPFLPAAKFPVCKWPAKRKKILCFKFKETNKADLFTLFLASILPLNRVLFFGFVLQKRVPFCV